MKKKRISMDKIRNILRMHAELGLGEPGCQILGKILKRNELLAACIAEIHVYRADELGKSGRVRMLFIPDKLQQIFYALKFVFA